ncbi:Glutathione S-transferase [Candidatus Rhodobacter oscarellae]|uniref:Glutathione S-transferase n=1 Tax=Candidatus Rhodobacter oscarellae TaxID=1675527 RepID=A0A0J9EEA9_9RHOB|nr:glutathione S-transferase family protein [Candidatus Rhodobacter lobularis]KMW60059.1 Glutathione S-transferase [Candidatus Rhodobacter lobularis]
MNIKLYSAWYCPFAQRTWIALEMLGLDYTYIEIDPYDKTEHWMEISRGKGQVPVVEFSDGKANRVRVPDSIRSLEFLNDLAAGQFWNNAPTLRADQRYWLDHINGWIVPQFYRFLKAPVGSAQSQESRTALSEGLASLETATVGRGSAIDAKHPGMLDVALFPFAYRMNLLLPYYKSFRPLAHASSLGDWFGEMCRSEDVRATSAQVEYYDDQLLQFYEPYAAGGGQEDVTTIAN